MNYFGFTLYFSTFKDRIKVTQYLKSTLASHTTVETCYADEFLNIELTFPYTLNVEGLRPDTYNFMRIYKLLSKITKSCTGTILIEYQHPNHPGDPYYSLLFSKNRTSLISDAAWADAQEIIIVEENYKIPNLWWKRFLIS